MANEFIHTEVGASLTEAEYDSVTGHSINNQARGDILISNTAASGLIRLAKGTEGHPLIMGANDPVWQSTESLILGGSITSGGAAAAGNFYHRFQSTFTSSGASTDVYGVRFEGAITGAAGDTTAIHNVGCVASITTQTASETIGVVSQLYLTEPGITKNVTTITTAATLYIAGAPTEGATNAALYVLAGETNIATLLVRDSLYLSERAGAQGDTGGRGQLWVKNESPCELWFTDDGGTDTQIVPARAKEVYSYPMVVDHATLGDGYADSLTALNNQSHMNMFIPYDFASVDEIVILVKPTTTNASQNWDVYSDYGGIGENHSASSEADTGTSHAGTADQYKEVDLSGVVGSIAAGDMLFIRIKLADAGHDVWVVGIRLKYIVT